MGSWNRGKQVKSNGDSCEFDDLLVFGYTSTIFQNDYQSEHIAEERHMVPCLGDAENRVDRYDCRLLLSSIDALNGEDATTEPCATEAMEEEMCDEERYLDMHKDMQREREEEEKMKRRTQRNASFGFDYGTGVVNENESDSEDEPFEAPNGVKFPVGLELPPNMKLYHIIEKTASFIVANGSQMEIVIKAKQRNNSEQFGFLEFDHKLNPFYKYLQKLIREKKYVTGCGKKYEKVTKLVNQTSHSKPTVSSSLAAIAAEHGSDSDDSDSDCELHPSLLSGGQNHPISPDKPGAIGPKKKPIEPEKAPEFSKPTGDISQRNDVYAALFKNLADVTRQASGVEEVKPENEKVVKEEEPNDYIEDPDYCQWYESFYGCKYPWIGPRPMIPPTPDLEPILSSYAEHVAQKGADFEATLLARADLQLHFMDPKSPYHSYYQHNVRNFQWHQSQAHEFAAYSSPIIHSSPVPLMSTELFPLPPMMGTSPGPSSLHSLNLTTPEPPLNRRQRRRLLESRADESILSEPGVIDPMSIIPKSASTPSNLLSLNSPKPISFSLKTPEMHDDSSYRFDPDDMDSSILSGPSTSTAHTVIESLPPPPTPPEITNFTHQMQVDRKERAKIFMEKLLQEKKAKKQQEEEERIRLEEETRRKAEKISESLSERKGLKNEAYISKGVVAASLDDMINSRINSLLSESGFHPVEEKKHGDEEDRVRRKHRKRSRSRCRSRSRSPRNREKSRIDRRNGRRSEKHRSRSPSSDRHHRRGRSKSRERGYRR